MGKRWIHRARAATNLKDDVVVVNCHASLRVDRVGEARQLVDVTQPTRVGRVHSRSLAAKQKHTYEVQNTQTLDVTLTSE